MSCLEILESQSRKKSGPSAGLFQQRPRTDIRGFHIFWSKEGGRNYKSNLFSYYFLLLFLLPLAISGGRRPQSLIISSAEAGLTVAEDI